MLQSYSAPCYHAYPAAAVCAIMALPKNVTLLRARNARQHTPRRRLFCRGSSPTLLHPTKHCKTIHTYPPSALQPYFNRFSYILPSGYGASCGWSGLGDIPVPYTIPGLAENFGKRVGKKCLPAVAAGQQG